jgi:hypothetical protein
MAELDTTPRFELSDIEVGVTKRNFVRVDICDGLVRFDLLPSQVTELVFRLQAAGRAATESRWDLPSPKRTA